MGRLGPGVSCWGWMGAGCGLGEVILSSGYIISFGLKNTVAHKYFVVKETGTGNYD